MSLPVLKSYCQSFCQVGCLFPDKLTPVSKLVFLVSLLESVYSHAGHCFARSCVQRLHQNPPLWMPPRAFSCAEQEQSHVTGGAAVTLCTSLLFSCLGQFFQDGRGPVRMVTPAAPPCSAWDCCGSDSFCFPRCFALLHDRAFLQRCVWHP